MSAAYSNWLRHATKCLKKEVTKVRDVNCKKCATNLGYGLDGIHHERKLVGGYKVIICVDCVNLWSEHLDSGAANNAFERTNDVELDIGVIQNCFVTSGGSNIQEAQDLLRPLFAKRRLIERELYDEAKAWVGIKAPVTAAP